MKRVDALKDLSEQRWEAHYRVHDREREAITKAEADVNKRLDGMNELRQQIDRERGTYITRETFSTVDDRLKLLENGRSNDQGRLWMMGIAISGAVLLINLAMHFWTK